MSGLCLQKILDLRILFNYLGMYLIKLAHCEGIFEILGIIFGVRSLFVYSFALL